ncbi:MAG: hypothetical protein K2X02_08160, partial [Alphaproteobacteria bacterium]|nr:hypothetical protein [Alphaproteobacteria bacterium]
MISTHKDTVAWVRKQNIPLYNSLEDFKAFTSPKTFDYLFSIVNRKIIKKELLAYPHVAAINFHDAPLPKYAGVHATSWAILNNESFHGISWHLMSEMTDGGGILKRVIFPLDKDETALTLNLKCYSHALESFRILIRELVKGSLIEKKQDLTKRSYFARYQKPGNLGFLCWEDSAQEIERFCRALSFGDYPNALTTPKILISGVVFIPNKVSIISSDSQMPPGTILQITGNSLQICTKTQDAILAGFKDIRGKSVNIEAFLASSNIGVGSAIKSPTQEDLTHWKSLFEDLAPYEDYWVHEVKNSFPFSLPFTEAPAENGKEQSSKEEIIIKDTLSGCFSSSRKVEKISFSETFLATFFIYLSRIGNASTLTVGIVNDCLKRLRNRYSFLLPSHLLLTFSLGENEKANDLVEQVKNKLDSLKKNKVYLEDVYVRYPEFKNIPLSAPIVINLDPIQAESMDENTPFVLTLDEKNNAYVFKVKTNLNETSKNLLHNSRKHIKKLFEQIVQNPETLIRDLSFVSEEEELQLLVKWNDTQQTYPANKTIHQLFEEQVEKTP